MDPHSFDTLTRVLTEPRSRRAAVTMALGGSLGLLGLTQADARRKKGKGKKKRKAAPGPTCTPTCGARTCGDDGCNGSCGACVGGACFNGGCVCPGATELCGGVCVSLCPAPFIRDPRNCGCCGVGLFISGIAGQCGAYECCSGDCRGAGVAALNICYPRTVGAACAFGAQCESNSCVSGRCA